MMVGVILVILAELAAYFVLIYRLAGLVRAKRPEFFASSGGLQIEDFLVLGFGTGDNLISKLEANEELRREADIASLLRWARIAWFAQMVTAIAAVFVILSS